MDWKQRFQIGWRLFRPPTLMASVVPVLVGTGLAIAQSHFHTGLFLSFFIACVLIQGATNMFNEYFDFRRGLDSDEMVGIAGAIVRDGVRPRTVLTLGWAFILVAVALGVYICASTTWWIALVGTLCIAVAYLYSGGPIPLSYTPFGELAASIAMGPVIVLLAYYIQANTITTSATIASIPIGLLIGALLLGNNIRDMDHDIEGGRRTIAILLGKTGGRILFAVVYVVTYVLLVLAVALQLLTPWALLVLLTVPSAYMVVRRYFETTDPSQLQVAFKGTAILMFRFGALMFAGLIVSALI